MGPGKQYYYRKRRAGGQVVAEYVGTGEIADLIARYDELRREQDAQQRAADQARRAAFLAETQVPAELLHYSAAVRGLVADVLRQLGFHQHRRQWRKRRMTTDLSTAALRARDLFCQEHLTSEERAELRGILDEQTALANGFGNLARVVWQDFIKPLGKAAPGLEVAIQARMVQLRRELGYTESSELEKLLIDEIVLCHFDYYRIERVYARTTSETLELGALQVWGAVLDLMQQSYLRAIAALARVRRLLKLPTVQVNIAAAGGQQVNVAGDIQA